MSRETTFERDLHAVRDKAELGAIFTSLCERVAADLQRKGYVGKTIGIKLRYDDFKSVTRDQTLDHYTADARTIRQTAGLCLKRVDLTRRLRLLGVRVGSLLRADEAESAQKQATAHADAASMLLIQEQEPHRCFESPRCLTDADAKLTLKSRTGGFHEPPPHAGGNAAHQALACGTPQRPSAGVPALGPAAQPVAAGLARLAARPVAFDRSLDLPLCLLASVAPRLYVGWRRHAHRLQRLRCDWLADKS